MKKILFVLIALMSISTLSTAQKSRSSSKSSSSSVRADRQIAITTNAGLKTISGLGIIGSYYVTPNVAVDLGLGTSLRGFRTGVRGRYLFTDNNFAPILGAGIIYQTGKFNFDEVLTEPIVDPETGDELLAAGSSINIQVNPSIFGQVITGFELMTDGGFVLGLTAGYRIALNDAISSAISANGEAVLIDDTVKDAANTLIGSGLSFGLNLGYAF